MEPDYSRYVPLKNHFTNGTRSNVDFFFAAANLLRNKEGSSASGPELFGFTNATIHALLQELPGVEQLKKYEKEEYELVPPKGPSKRARAKARKEEGDESEGGSGLPEDEDEFSGMEE